MKGRLKPTNLFHALVSISIVIYQKYDGTCKNWIKEPLDCLLGEPICIGIHIDTHRGKIDLRRPFGSTHTCASLIIHTSEV